MLRHLADEPDLVCLTGAWAGGSTLVSWRATSVVEHVPAGPLSGAWWFGLLAYDGRSRVAGHDHVLRLRDGRWCFEVSAWTEALEQRFDELAARLAGPPPVRTCSVGAFDGTDAGSRLAHLAAVEGAITSIRAGDLYQVNVCTRLTAPFAGDPVAAFVRLLSLRPDYAAFVRDGDRHVLSASPELFLRRQGRDVVTRPIKGTLPQTADGDRRLRRSAKDRAENVMIVDLLRNDLGRVCATGTVRVPALFDVEAHAGVWQLVSTVRGRLRPEVDDAALLAATFPPGSVTGAPKTRAVGEIAALEAWPRSVYTGAIGHLGGDEAEWNVAIRTFEIEGGRIALGVGGGITADSVPAREWNECLHKAAPLIDALGAGFAASPEPSPGAPRAAGGLLETLCARDGRALRAGDHLARLDRSSRELYDVPIPDELPRRVRAAARALGTGVVRVVLEPGGRCSVTSAPPPNAAPATVFRTVRRDGVWRHKWADRGDLAADEAADAAPLYVADDGTVLETSRGNVFLLLPDGTLVTPPLRDDLLPGVTRRAVLDLARDTGRPVRLRCFAPAELRAAVAFWTSSLRGAVPIHVLDGVRLPRDDAAVAELAAVLLAGASFVS